MKPSPDASTPTFILSHTGNSFDKDTKDAAQVTLQPCYYGYLTVHALLYRSPNSPYTSARENSETGTCSLSFSTFSLSSTT